MVSGETFEVQYIMIKSTFRVHIRNELFIKVYASWSMTENIYQHQLQYYNDFERSKTIVLTHMHRTIFNLNIFI